MTATIDADRAGQFGGLKMGQCASAQVSLPPIWSLSGTFWPRLKRRKAAREQVAGYSDGAVGAKSIGQAVF